MTDRRAARRTCDARYALRSDGVPASFGIMAARPDTLTDGRDPGRFAAAALDPGTLLIAMPGMGDPRFSTAVILLCRHGDAGSMGLMLNRPIPGMTMGKLMAGLDIEVSDTIRGRKVHSGGPVDPARGFVVHPVGAFTAEGALAIGDSFAMTATRSCLVRIGQDDGPRRWRLALGYAGWGPGQLDGEIARNGWLTAPATPHIVFDTEAGDTWRTALSAIGVDPLALSDRAGRA